MCRTVRGAAEEVHRCATDASRREQKNGPDDAHHDQYASTRRYRAQSAQRRITGRVWITSRTPAMLETVRSRRRFGAAVVVLLPRAHPIPSSYSSRP